MRNSKKLQVVFVNSCMISHVQGKFCMRLHTYPLKGDESVPSVRNYTQSPELFGCTCKVMGFVCMCICPFFFSGEKSHYCMIYKGFDDTSKGKKLGTSALKYFQCHRKKQRPRLNEFSHMMNVKYLFVFLKIPLENIF